jgi:hypothetical protein
MCSRPRSVEPDNDLSRGEQQPFIIIDDFLTSEHQEAVWLYIQREHLQRVDVATPTGQWAWHDGGALRGSTIGRRSKWHGQYPSGTALDLMMDRLVLAAERLTAVIGRLGEDWDDFTAFATLYPPGSGLMWHRDAPDNAGSYVYYAHPTWNAEWGGELLLGATAQLSLPVELGPFLNPAPRHLAEAGESWLNAHLDNSRASDLLLEPGAGTFVAPKPNRLVVIRGGLPHKISKVSIAAGSHLRTSIGGFFKRPTPPQP